MPFGGYSSIGGPSVPSSSKPRKPRGGIGMRGPLSTSSQGPPATGGGGGGGGGISFGPVTGGGGGGTPAITQPKRPELTPIKPEAAFDPRLTGVADEYAQTGKDLREGTGFAMDALRQQQEQSKEAELDRMESAAAAAGIPFDRRRAATEIERGINTAMAQEKLGREQLVQQHYQGGMGVYGAPSSERDKRLEMDLRRDVAENELGLDRYGRDIQKYGIDVNASTAANNALMGFYQSLMGGFTGMMGNLGNLSMTNQYG